MAKRESTRMSGDAFSCDTVVAVGDSTADGTILLAKNSDRRALEAQRLIGVPRGESEGSAPVRCTHAEAPGTKHTAALIGSQPYWMWGFEHGLNEYGVAIGNEAIHTRDVPNETGLLGMDLVRLALERGRSACEALAVITNLLAEFGQGGSAEHHFARYYQNSFLIADPRDAWVLETSGRHWVALQVKRGAYAISNRPTIGSDYDLASPALISHAEDQGWWPRAKRPFDFAAAYTSDDYPGLAGASCRLTRSRGHLAGGALTPQAMMNLLRDHGTAAAGDSSAAWPSGTDPGTLCMHGLMDMGATAASMVAHLSTTSLPVYWGSMGPPCTGIFVPYWVDAAPPAELAVADEAASPVSPWWRFRRLWEAVAAVPDPGELVSRLRASWVTIETTIREAISSLGPDAAALARRQVSERAIRAVSDQLANLERELVTVEGATS